MTNNLSLTLFDLRSKFDNTDVYILGHTADYTRISFDRFRNRSLSWATKLKDRGIDRDKKVLITFPDIIEAHCLFHALVRLGAQIYFVHHDTDIADLNKICDQYQIQVVIGQYKSIFQVTSDCVEQVLDLPDIVMGPRYDELEEAYNYLDEDFAVAYVRKSTQNHYQLESFTHGDLVRAMTDMDTIFQFDDQSVILNAALPVSYALGTMINTIAPFRYGSTHFLIDFYSAMASINQYINNNKITTFIGTPYVIDTMLNHYRAELEHCPENFYVTGERLSAELWNRIKQRFQISPKNLFSTSANLMPLLCPGTQSHSDLGTPRDDIGIRINNDSLLEFLPRRSDNWYTTPDICTIDDNGHYQYVCHRDQLHVINGVTINGLDLEDQLLCHPSIEDCRVSFDNDTVVIDVVLAPNQTLSAEDQANLISIPASWNFIEAVSRTLNKKKQRSRQ